ncbi:uncharacterized protein A4U43_C07F7510 [Asparagus officinalis]|uniref:Uncharacterized protein n=1 Tax=Asparagus officinalis TaxID=4686 RepID=A0A5P1EA42_ASPOF|nr:uncharacterized protein A4U43_C07F7510 [Asparagus officinalis]
MREETMKETIMMMASMPTSSFMSLRIEDWIEGYKGLFGSREVMEMDFEVRSAMMGSTERWLKVKRREETTKERRRRGRKRYYDIDTAVEDPPTGTPCIDTFIEDEDAPLIIPMNKRKRGAKVAREKVLATAPLKTKRVRRAMKHSKHIVTPYTEGKKKKEKQSIEDNVIIEVVEKEKDQVEEKEAELAPAGLQCDPHSIWKKTHEFPYEQGRRNL